MHRRNFVGTAAGAGLLGLAGCVASASPSPPDVPDDLLAANDWELVDEEQAAAFSESVAGQEITATATTEIYENAPLREDLAEKTLGEVTEGPVTFFASRVTFDPDLTNLPGGVGREQVIDEVEANARDQLTAQMEANGVEGVETVDEGELTVDSGESARRTDMEGVLPFEPISVPVTDDEELAIDEDGIPVAGRLAVWHAEESVLVAGGAFPAENFAADLDEALSSAVSVSIEVDLELDPEQYEDDLLELVRSVA
ncbi:DUF6517 family protein [Halorubrum gandharaense]